MITIAPTQPVLIAGPTASGKSALALHIAKTLGGVVVNADALQVFDGWRILTARPDDDELSQADHALYGHVQFDAPYSTGQWLRDVRPYLDGAVRPIIVGGTGLNFAALTQGLADIPPTPDQVRSDGNAMALGAMLDQLDQRTKDRIDIQNRMRVQRAWEVLTAPLVDIKSAAAITLDVPTDWLNDRIVRRFELMLDTGAVDEAAAMLPTWDPANQSSKAIGAPEMIAHLKGDITLKEAKSRAVIASRQYAKRQRTWFRSKHKSWVKLDVSSTDLSTAIS